MEGSCTSGNSGAPPPAAPLASLSNAGATSRSVEPEEETEKAHGSRVCPGGGPGKAEEAVGKDQGAASVLLGTAIGPEHVAASQQQQQQQQLWTGLGGDGRCSGDQAMCAALLSPGMCLARAFIGAQRLLKKSRNLRPQTET
eukprot:scaffold481_cov19-Tisochrysis_lutea.AAC.1